MGGFENGVGRDGIKTLCLDDIYRDIKNKECLIYSFGIADDWTFEEYMASLGCKVHAFDPTVDEELAINKTSKNLSFSKIALFREAADDLDFGSGSLNKGMPFKNILESFNDSEKKITVLKMDVEGEEMWSLPQMVQSRAFINVQQVHMEVHVNEKRVVWRHGQD